MSRIGDWMQEPARDVRVAAQADVVVVGGGPAGSVGGLAAARNGARVTLLERYNHLGGLASGGMVLVLDDMWDSHLQEISVRGTCMEMIERMASLGLAEVPARTSGARARSRSSAGSAGAPSTSTARRSRTRSCFAAAFDPDAWKRVALEHGARAGIELRLHSWFSRTLVEDGKVKGVVCDTKNGREAILGNVVIDATGDLDVAASAGAPHIGGSYIVTTVFRLGGVDTDEAERFERESRKPSRRWTARSSACWAAAGRTGG
jgi:flavin-dependent dehydrogenase